MAGLVFSLRPVNKPGYMLWHLLGWIVILGMSFMCSDYDIQIRIIVARSHSSFFMSLLWQICTSLLQNAACLYFFCKTDKRGKHFKYSKCPQWQICQRCSFKKEGGTRVFSCNTKWHWLQKYTWLLYKMTHGSASWSVVTAVKVSVT